MKKLNRPDIIAIVAFALVGIWSAATISQAQTITQVRAKYNARTCAANSLTPLCTQADVDAAVAANKTPGGTIYATDAAFRDGYVLPKLVAKEAEEDLSADANRLVRAFVNGSKAQRTAACSALGIVC